VRGLGVLSALLTLFSGTLEDYVPPRFLSGEPPRLSPLAAGGGIVVAEARVAPSGIVRELPVIDDAPPFTEEIRRVVRLWRFDPATDGGEAVDSRAAIVALIRAPVLHGGAPPPPRRVAAPSGEVPYPREMPAPVFPPQALYQGVVMMEAEVDEEGAVAYVEVLSPAEGFTELALDAARAFRFEPARRDGAPLRAHAILIFGFAQPVTRPRIPR
jgi:TonB family protein